MRHPPRRSESWLLFDDEHEQIEREHITREQIITAMKFLS
jgi:hypothetical protein